MNLTSTIELHAGGPGSGCKGPNCGRPKGEIYHHTSPLGVLGILHDKQLRPGASIFSTYHNVSFTTDPDFVSKRMSEKVMGTTGVQALGVRLVFDRKRVEVGTRLERYSEEKEPGFSKKRWLEREGAPWVPEKEVRAPESTSVGLRGLKEIHLYPKILAKEKVRFKDSFEGFVKRLQKISPVPVKVMS